MRKIVFLTKKKKLFGYNNITDSVFFNLSTLAYSKVVTFECARVNGFELLNGFEPPLDQIKTS